MNLCRICNHVSAEIRYSFDSHVIYACPACGLMSLHPQPSPGALREIYQSEDYFINRKFFEGANESIFGYADYFAERAHRQKQFSRIAGRCMNALLRSGHPKRAERYRLLEIGCGPGFFIREAEQKGFEAHGIEFNTKIAPLVDGGIADRIHFVDFENIDGPPIGEFDCIVMLDVIEHFRDPVKIIQKVRKLLVPGGIFVLSTVDSGSLSSRMIGKRLEDFRRMREHFYFFNRKNISSLLRAHHFAVDSIASIGHTFRLDHLLNRVLLIYGKPWDTGSGPGAALMKLLSRISVYLNPRTKMIVFSRDIGDDPP
jgi:SAM-dependent methyltransferase